MLTNKGSQDHERPEPESLSTRGTEERSSETQASAGSVWQLKLLRFTTNKLKSEDFIKLKPRRVPNFYSSPGPD
jgi:hypothetical protein